ncbi:hypothetical protein QTG54_002569 [Skeletonema marinoi]|uniref:MYND-type domain-containing protein n=1 Tax=Skeletonema marinoi TaxID=267567 RepID=A0AAD9DIT7_9STRA|nr:hypothetical protein QTG54_002569 [Skeletonema marinoi]
MMSGEEESDMMMCCASCGIGQVDDIKLKKCTACYLVRYCSVKCQKEHRPKHKRACKKRAAELRDEILFKQPESTNLGDCPICFLPVSIDTKKSSMGERCSDEKDYKSAVEYWTKAAELGDAGAHYNLSISYRDGLGVERDEKKKVYHSEQAAIGGDPFARSRLGCEEWSNGRTDRAVKHWIIAAKLQDEMAVSALQDAYREGCVRKEDFASALRGHQAAVDSTKSPQRDEAEAFMIHHKLRGLGG